MSNIKAGFRKCGIFTLNPNDIDKSQLSRSKIIPDEDVDLSIPAEETSDNVNNAVQVAVPDEATLLPDLPASISEEPSDNIAVAENFANAAKLQTQTFVSKICCLNYSLPTK